VAIYLAFVAGGSGGHGWAAVVSTDTTLALGVLVLAARGGTRVRVRVLTISVIDDLVALVLIVTVYTSDVSVVPLLVAVGFLAALAALRYVPPRWRGEVAVFLAPAAWVAMYESHIDPVIAGLAIGLVTTAYPPQRAKLEQVVELARLFREQPTPELARTAEAGVASAISANERLQYRLHPWTSFVIVPLFALANAGVHLTGGVLSHAFASPITLGIIVAFVVGKPLGITGAALLGIRLRLGRRTLSTPVIVAAGTVGGIGFTVALLISSIAFHGQELADAKVGILAAAIVAAASSWLVFQVIRRLPESTRARQIAGTADDIVDLSEDVDPERDHIRGAEDATVTLLEYGDYECSYCGQAEVIVRELLASFGDDVRYVWRHLPLNDVHPGAQRAAEAAEAAAAQGAFWEMHDKLLEHAGDIAPPDLRRFAEEVGLDMDRFWADLRRHAHAGRIADDVASADESGVVGTPTFFINGKRHHGAYDVTTLTAAVRAARRRAELLRRVSAAA
jgi:Na+/H+ antiporter NhaA